MTQHETKTQSIKQGEGGIQTTCHSHPATTKQHTNTQYIHIFLII